MSPALAFLSILNIVLTIGCCIHVMQTGRPIWWLIILVLFNMFGVLAYALIELAPAAARSRTGREVGTAARDIVDPHREARGAIARLQVARTAENLLNAGVALIDAGQPGDAVELLTEATSGPHADDPALLSALARAQFEAGDPSAARRTLEAVKEADPDYRSPAAHLLYARALEGEGRTDEALATYEAVSAYYPGAEARARWGLLLDAAGRDEDAQARWTEILDTARIAPPHVRKAQREWIDLARSRVAG